MLYNKNPRKQKEKECEICGNKFLYYPSAHKNRKYCSRKCYYKSKIGNIDGFTTENMSGQNNPNWKGGISPFNKLLRRNSKYKIWREAVFLRDNFTCQNPNCEFCNNKIGVYLHPHHIKSVALSPELAFKIDNGITYCAEFHIKGGLHKGMKHIYTVRRRERK